MWRQPNCGHADTPPRPRFQLAGIDEPISLIAPIAWPDASSAHGALVVLGENNFDAAPALRAARLMALAIDTEFEHVSPTVATAEDEATMEPVSDPPGISSVAPSPFDIVGTSFSAKTLVKAMQSGQIRPWYQPIFELDSMRTVAVEALARWVPSDGELISPGEFIPSIQLHGLMSRLTATMLRDTVRDVAKWRSQGLVGPGFKASVNVAMSDLTGGMLPTVVQSLLDEFELDPSFLSLELTETEAMADIDHSLTMLHQLRSLGIGLSIDDFGTGYSSLSYLSQLPVDIVKIDRAFVAGLATSRGDEAVIGAVVDVAGAVGLTVLAEGIETEVQLVHLRSLGVTLGQGFLVSPAVEAQALIEYLEQQPDSAWTAPTSELADADLLAGNLVPSGDEKS